MYQTNINPMYGYQYQPRQRLMKCFPVTSVDEARAAMIDVDGSVTVFPDLANGKIYTKSVDLNGLAVMQTYKIVNSNAPQTTEQRINEIEYSISCLREELENVKQSNLSVSKSAPKKSKSTASDDTNAGE